jgi:hypothetical protein
MMMMMMMMMMIEVRKLATDINALGTGELLPRSGDFSGSGAMSPHHNKKGTMSLG